MADIFTKTNRDREAAAEAARAAAAPKLPGPDPATGISFTGRGGPVVDPEKSAALKAARIRQLRDGV
jgi:hypothetical protein